MREKHILAMCDSPFIVKLYSTFKDSQYLYFLLEPCLGGELYYVYNRLRLHGKIPHARFYSACIVLAFEYLHARNVVYRDLKPENVCLDSNGYAKLTDLGLAKVIPGIAGHGKTFTMCGTPDYFAPEVLLHSGTCRATDWWTFGILLHELLSGHSPFESADPMETYHRILRGVGAISFTYQDSDAVHLVKDLLNHEPADRIAMRVGGLEENMKVHTWYGKAVVGEEWLWKELESQGARAPFKPIVKGVTDAGNYLATEEDLPPNVPYKDDGSEWDKGFETTVQETKEG